MSRSGSDQDTARASVAEQGLVPDAVAQLTPIVRALPLESLGPVKQLLKRYFSDAPWSADDEVALADLIGNEPAGGASGRHELALGLALAWGWDDDRFRLRVERAAPDDLPVARAGTVDETDDGRRERELGATFDGVVVPEATPSPRTIRFATPPIHDGPARVYDSAEAGAADPIVGPLFRAFDEITNVLVGPNFLAVTIARPDRWEALLAPMLQLLTERFADSTERPAVDAPATLTRSVAAESDPPRASRRLERAWAELGALRADWAEDLDRIVAAARDDEAARRQVAAVLLAGAPQDVAARTWERMLADRSRSVRRSVVDAIAGAERDALRPLLERALDDADAWIRWKALHGIAAIGAEPSRAAVDARAADPDFRVRLEAAKVRVGDGRAP